MKYLLYIILILFTNISFAGEIESIIDNNLSISPIVFQQKVSEDKIDLTTAPFKQAIRSNSINSISILPISGLTINFNRKKEEQRNLKYQSLSLLEENSFNIGYSNKRMSISFQQNEKDTYDPLAWNLNSSLNKLQNIQTSILKFSNQIGEKGSFNFTRNTQKTTKTNISYDYSKTDSFSLKLPTNYGNFSFLNSNTEVNNITTAEERQLKAEIPINTKGLYTGNFTRKLQNNKDIETNEYTIMYPFSSKHSVSFQHSNSFTNDKLTSDKEEFKIILPLFGEDTKYVNSSSNNNSNKEYKKEILLPLTKLFQNSVYKMTDNISYINSIIKTRNMSENVIISDFLIKGSKFSYDRNIQISSGKTQSDLLTRQVLIPLEFLSKGSSYQFISQRKSLSNITDCDQNILKVPFKNISFIYTNSSIDTNNKQTNSINQYDLSYQFKLLGILLNNNYSYIDNNITEKTDSRFFTTIKFPIGNKLTSDNTLSFSTLGQDKIVSNFNVPFNFGILKLSRTYIDEQNDNKDNTTYTVESPKIQLPIHNMTMKGNMLIYEQRGQDTKEKKNVNLEWQPTTTLKTSLTLESNELVAKETDSITVETSYAMSKRTNMNLQYLEKQQLDSIDKAQTTFFVQHEDKSHDLLIKSTLVDINGTEDYPIFRNIEVNVGNSKTFQISAKMIDYDTKKLIPLNDDVYSFEFKRKGLSLQYRTIDRKLPLFGINTLLEIGDTTELKLSMENNGLNPNDSKKTQIREGTVFDLGISKKVSNLSLQANMRNYEDDNWYNIEIGSNQKKEESFSLSYKSGDFIPSNQKVTTESLFSLNYSKKLDNDGKILIDISKQVTDKDNIEAKAEININY